MLYEHALKMASVPQSFWVSVAIKKAFLHFGKNLPRAVEQVYTFHRQKLDILPM